ncbi:MAG: hypothetical protein ACRD3T_21345 [Terriglobia bacterium]
MANRELNTDIDPNPLVTAIVEKTKAGRLDWQPTADDRVYIASVGGDTTMKLTVEGVEEEVWDKYTSKTEIVDYPVLSLEDSGGRTIWKMNSKSVKGGLQPLYDLAQRVANKVDDRMASLMETLQKL